MIRGPKDRNKAEAMLREIEQDPTGWPSVDLDRLLTLWGIEGDMPLGPEPRWGARLRFHEDLPRLNVVLFPLTRVHVKTTLHVLAIIQELKGLLAEQEGGPPDA